MTQFVTSGAAAYLDSSSGTNLPEYFRVVLKKGRTWVRRAGHPTTSDDLAFLAYRCHAACSDLYRRHRLDDDYLAAGDVLDEFVTDHDAELLCQLLPLLPVPPVGSMTPHVTAVHDVLLDICATIRERWEAHDEEEAA